MQILMIPKNRVLALLAVILLVACGKRDDTPQNVQEAFTAKFPNAKSVEWDMEDENEWEAEFKMNGAEYSANFDKTGTWMETEREIQLEETPKSILDSLSTNFSGFQIEKMEMVQDRKGVVYEAELEKDDKELKIVIDPNGKIITQNGKEYKG